MWDVLSSCARCFTFRSDKSLKHRGKRKEFYLRKGQEKLERDLDIVNLLNLIKGYRQMRQALFDQNQLLFLQFQKRDVLHSETSALESNLSDTNFNDLFTQDVKSEQRQNKIDELQ